MKFNILATAFSFLLIGAALLVSPEVTSAQAGGLVPCDGPECNACHLMRLAERVIEFIVQISFVISALLFTVAGFMLFTAGADPGKVTKARKIFTDTIVGIIIILTAWLVVNVILTVLVGEGVNPFTKVLCSNDSTSTPNNPDVGFDGVKVGGSKPPEQDYRISGVANVTYDNGASGQTSISIGPFSTQQECYTAMLEAQKHTSNETVASVEWTGEFFTDCDDADKTNGSSTDGGAFGGGDAGGND